MRRNATMLVIWLILWGIVQPEGRAQDLPEIRELRVPERRVGDYFPPGTALRVLTRPEWDATLERARRGIDAAQESRVPRILKARHEARWDAGRLIGQSRFEVSNAESRPCAVHLEPWSLACEAGEGVLVPRTRADGSLVLWLEEDAPTPYQVRWQARAREGSDGRIFAFTLPAASVSSLELELPQDLEPISTTGQRSRVGAPSASGVARWKFDGITGPVVLALR
jgi:hypothetical protein